MKVIFLDVDGVLNNMTNCHIDYLHPPLLDLLKQICNETQAKIVVSSTWRISPRTFKLLKWRLKELGCEVIGKTPQLNLERHHEIRHWINEHNPIQFAIIDDDVDAAMQEYPQCFFQTSWKEGLTEDIALKVVRFLK